MTAPGFGLYIAISKTQFLRLNPGLLLLNADYGPETLMNNWLETITLPQEQLQLSAKH